MGSVTDGFLGLVDIHGRRNGEFNPKYFGAKGDGTTSDTAAIQLALDAADAYGGKVKLPPGRFLLDGDGAQLLRIKGLIHFEGSGFLTQLVVSPEVADTTDVLAIHPKGVGYGEYIVVRNMLLIALSGVPARHGIRIDTTEAGRTISKLLIEQVSIRTFGGYGIASVNPTNVDGFFASTIRNCGIRNGVALAQSGDALNIIENTITGANCGVQVDAVDGALQVIIARNVITTSGGAVRVINGGQTKIRDNQIEQIVEHTGSDKAMISLVGRAAYPLTGVEVTGNNMYDVSGQADSRNILLQYVANPAIRNNRLARSDGGSHIEILAGAKNVEIGPNVYQKTSVPFTQSPAVIVDGGKATRGVWAEATLENSWTNFNSGYYSTAGYMLDSSGMVHLKGLIKDGVTTATTVILTLPEGFRPALIHRFGVVSDTTGTTVHGMFSVNPNGTVTISRGGNTFFQLDGVSFPADPLTTMTS